MKCEIIFPILEVTTGITVSEEADNDELADFITKEFATRYRIKPSQVKLQALFDINDDNLVAWISHRRFDLAHGLIHMNGKPVTEFWFRAYKDKKGTA